MRGGHDRRNGRGFGLWGTKGQTTRRGADFHGVQEDGHEGKEVLHAFPDVVLHRHPVLRGGSHTGVLDVVDGLLHFLRVRVGKGEIMAEGGTPEGGEDDEGNHRQQGRDSQDGGRASVSKGT